MFICEFSTLRNAKINPLANQDVFVKHRCPKQQQRPIEAKNINVLHFYLMGM